MAETKRDLRQEVTDQIIRALEQGTAPWQKPWQSGALELPFNPVSGKSYRGGNVVQLMVVASSKGYDDPRWVTYRQAQENGWQVRRGEKGTHVEFWQFPNRTAKPDGDSKDDPGKAERESFIYRAYTVFNAKQLDGIPAHAPKVRPEWEVLESAEAILRCSGARISYDQSNQAFYNRRTDSIHFHPGRLSKQQANFYGTALHELCHWSGTPDRLNRETLNESYRFGDPNYAREELRAELASVFLMAERGIPHNPERHASYLNSWLEALRNDKHEIFRAARDAHKAADLLLLLELHQSLDKALAEVNKPSAAKDLPPEPELKNTAALAMNARSGVQVEL